MVRPYLKNKGSAVRFCLWPQGFFLVFIKLGQELGQALPKTPISTVGYFFSLGAVYHPKCFRLFFFCSNLGQVFFLFFMVSAYAVYNQQSIAYVNLPCLYLYRNTSRNVRNIDRPAGVNVGGTVIYNVSPQKIGGNCRSRNSLSFLSQLNLIVSCYEDS